MTIHANDFAERLQRIEAGGAYTRNALFVGLDETYVVTRSKGPTPKAKGQALVNLAYPMTMVVALASGILSVFLIKLLRFHTDSTAPIGGEPLNDLALESALALVLCVAVGRWIWRDFGALRSWQAMGVLFMAVGWHNVVHLAPETFGMIFSEGWTARVLSSTEFRSFVIRGFTIPF